MRLYNFLKFLVFVFLYILFILLLYCCTLYFFVASVTLVVTVLMSLLWYYYDVVVRWTMDEVVGDCNCDLGDDDAAATKLG